MDALLEVRGLRTHFDTDRGLFRAVDGIDFAVGRGKTVGLVGSGTIARTRALIRISPTEARGTFPGAIPAWGRRADRR